MFLKWIGSSRPEDGKAQAHFVAGLRIAWCSSETDWIFNRIRQTGNQLHAAAWAASGLELADIWIHRAQEFNRFFSRLLGKSGKRSREEYAA